MEQRLAVERGRATQERERGVQLRTNLSDLRARRTRLEKELAALLVRIDILAKQGIGQERRMAELRVAVERAQQRVASKPIAKPIDPTTLDEEERGLEIYYRQLREVTQT